MVWKILSVITALCLGAAAFFAFDNSKKVKAEKELLTRAETNHQQLLDKKKEGEETQERKKTQLAQVEKDRDQTKEDVVKAVAEVQEKEAALALLKSNLDQVTQQVAALEAKIRDAGDIKALIAQIDALKKDQLEAEGELTNKQQALAQAQEQLAELQGQVRSFEAYEERIRKGVVEPDFNARVAGVFNDWGFVMLNKGNNGGVFANAVLDVKRGQDVIAKLRVKNVEPNSSVADVIKGSVVEGESIRSGDLVVAASSQPVVDRGGPVKKAEPGTGGPTISTELPAPTPAVPMEGAAPASDPFGSAPAMDGGAAPASDPFGSAPAPAPAMDGGAAPAPDPFGASAPAPSPAPSSDPSAN